MTRKVPGAKNTVAGQLHYCEGNDSAGAPGEKKKQRGKGSGKSRQQKQAAQKARSGQSKGNSTSKKGRKRPPPTVSGGGAGTSAKRPKNSSGVPLGHQKVWPCHNSGTPGHFQAKCPQPRVKKAVVAAATNK